MRIWHDTTYVTPRWRVLLTNLCELLGREVFGEPNEGWPKPPMNQRDFSVDQPAYKDLVRIGHRAKDRKDVVALRMGPPASRDGFAGDSFGKARRASLGRNEDYAMPSDKSQCLLSSGAGPSRRQRDIWHHAFASSTMSFTSRIGLG